jgi:hypothetical protein
MQLMAYRLNSKKMMNSDEILLKVVKKQHNDSELKVINDGEVNDLISLKPKPVQNPYKHEKLL